MENELFVSVVMMRMYLMLCSVPGSLGNVMLGYMSDSLDSCLISQEIMELESLNDFFGVW